MREITDHRVNPANDTIKITVFDEPGAGGANHHYMVTLPDWTRGPDGSGAKGVWDIQFQNGPKAENKERHEIEMYGADAADWLARWDAGKTVWSIEMGGLGPGYEQCIHITAAEILRHLLAEQYDLARWEHKPLWTEDREAIEKYGFANPVIEKLGLSGAQWGAAINLACNLYRDGPRAVMTDARVKDRHIQVRRDFPQAVAA